MTPLFETILDYIPAPEGDPDANTQVLISTIDYNEYVGRIGIGKVDNGSVKVGQDVVIVNAHDKDKLNKVRITKLYEFDGLKKVEVTEATIGSIVAISGVTDIHIGDTICSPEHPEPIPFQKILEPMERAFVDVPEEFAGSVIEKLSTRKGELQGMGSIGGGFTRLEFVIPSRGLIGYRGEFMTDTKGNGILNTVFEDYGPYKGDIAYRKQGSLIAFESGETVAYGLFNAQDRGTLFVGPGEKVYAGMVIGQNGKTEDIELNVCKTKHLTNTRSSSADDALKLTPPKVLSLEEALEFIDTDELLEITPENLRIRKKILDPTLRFRAKKNATNG